MDKGKDFWHLFELTKKFIWGFPWLNYPEYLAKEELKKYYLSEWMYFMCPHSYNQQIFIEDPLCISRYSGGAAQLCLTLCDPTYSSVHGIFQIRILEWVAIFYSRASYWPRDQTHVSYVFCTGRQVLYHWETWEAITILVTRKTTLSWNKFPAQRFPIPASANILRRSFEIPLCAVSNSHSFFIILLLFLALSHYLNCYRFYLSCLCYTPSIKMQASFLYLTYMTWDGVKPQRTEDSFYLYG